MTESSDVMVWEEFERLHVVRRLRQIIGNWWKIQINFTDAHGFVRGVPQGKFFNPINPICTLITANDEGFRDCMSIARKTTFDNIAASGPVVSMCHAGFSTLTLPIRIGQRYMGCLFADGFFIEESVKEQKEILRKYLEDGFAAEAEVMLTHIESLPVLSNKDLNYLTELLQVVIEEALTVRKTLSEHDERLDFLTKELSSKWDFGKMVGRSRPMMELFKLLTRVCESDATILITGENGTGKEGIARAMHFNSHRKKSAFIVQNCGAMNDNLLESELFGHVKGAFTSAIKDKKGLFEVADQGTLFLDEIGDTSPAMQVKLLRVLQEGTFIAVGGTEQKRVDVRILAATNRNLEEMVHNGSFREDLYYRLNVINVKVPPLRDRKDDIPILVQRFLEEHAENGKIPLKRLSAGCLKQLEKHDWPGNVRELQNEVERLCVLCGEETVIPEELLSERIVQSREERFPGLRVEGKLKDAVEELEKRMILESLMREDWNKSSVARKLGISRASLIMKCAKFSLDRDDRYRASGE